MSAVASSREREEGGLEARQNWVPVPAPPLPSWVALGASRNLCFSSYGMGVLPFRVL